MPMLTGSALVALVLAALAPSALGHGWITEPPARNAASSPRNGHCPHCGNGNGVCGDGNQWPSGSNYVGLNDGPQRTYTAGEVVEMKIRITAHHRGHMELHICDEHLGPQTLNPEGPSGCLSKWVLERVPPEQVHSDCVVNDARDDCQPLDVQYPERWYLPPGTGEHTMHFRIPEGLQCESCTLQWRWWTANSCIPADGYGCYFSRMRQLGWDAGSWCGAFCGSDSCPSSLLESNVSRAAQHAGSERRCGEEFRNCADIRVLGSGSTGPSPMPSPTPAPMPSTTPSPMPSPMPTPMPPATTTGAPAPAGSCVRNIDCVANAWCNDPAYVGWCELHSAAQCPSPQCMLASAVPTPAPVPSTTAAPAPATTTMTATTTMPMETTAAPTTPAPMPTTCASCPGETACIWSDGLCYPSMAQEVCEATAGAMWCGAPAPTPAPSVCGTCPGEHACIWSDGLCYERVARNVCEETVGAVWCGAGSEPEPEGEPEPEPEPVSAMQVVPHGPQAERKKISQHRQGFLATALLQAAAALERVFPLQDGAAEL